MSRALFLTRLADSIPFAIYGLSTCQGRLLMLPDSYQCRQGGVYIHVQPLIVCQLKYFFSNPAKKRALRELIT